ncbi:uncharacterized protein MONOS_9148 [Monocercomonoides exilis]|uniref:uncharacterized protein n=1 Tax=Monocercomonoides exilis TaxID=2049356 RepID=UPI00355A4C5C|nr:hypothetical protein MONOS_9148 [Monocercomonoides exilis]|eukprot:MONOS_9148.1-p1 / transcript=MONOS_9148.1 / gene=MONOS_9148 / organism=Monocercomonoides_exilis_PA203 / gene_product=unspecified product / transcript_product=unspecified product / location=Mono_scaffold00368:51310-51992(+) / protein_length=196 / sequence_SO=supercontig / SO=protein_coding / is_pseudo=false
MKMLVCVLNAARKTSLRPSLHLQQFLGSLCYSERGKAKIIQHGMSSCHHLHSTLMKLTLQMRLSLWYHLHRISYVQHRDAAEVFAKCKKSELRELKRLRGYVVCTHDVVLSKIHSVLLVAPLPSLAAQVGMNSADVSISAIDEHGGEFYDGAMGQSAQWCEVDEIAEKAQNVLGKKMENEILSPAAIALAVLEKR